MADQSIAYSLFNPLAYAPLIPKNCPNCGHDLKKDSLAYSLFSPPADIPHASPKAPYQPYTLYSNGHRFDFVPSFSIPHYYSNSILGMAFPGENRALVSIDQDEFHRRETMEHEKIHLDDPALTESQVRAKTVENLRAKGCTVEAHIAAQHLEDFRNARYASMYV